MKNSYSFISEKANRNYSIKIFYAVVAAAIIAMVSCRMYYPVQKVDYGSIHASPEKINEGRHLTMLMCGACHYDPATKKLTGLRMEDMPGIVGKVYATNLTKHKEKGLGNYTDGELAYLLRTGIARDGKLMPFMQRPNLSDDDLKSVIAFLRSDDKLVEASDVMPGKTKYTFLGKMGISKSKPLAYPSKEIPEPDMTDNIKRGKYLVDNLGCYDCHSKSFMSLNKTEPEKSKGYMGGGTKLIDKNRKSVTAPNLTPHPTGIGKWSLEDFKSAMGLGIFPMPKYSELTDQELTAIYEYLKSIPPIDNKISK